MFLIRRQLPYRSILSHKRMSHILLAQQIPTLATHLQQDLRLQILGNTRCFAHTSNGTTSADQLEIGVKDVQGEGGTKRAITRKTLTKDRFTIILPRTIT